MHIDNFDQTDARDRFYVRVVWLAVVTLFTPYALWKTRHRISDGIFPRRFSMVGLPPYVTAAELAVPQNVRILIKHSTPMLFVWCVALQAAGGAHWWCRGFKDVVSSFMNTMDKPSSCTLQEGLELPGWQNCVPEDFLLRLQYLGETTGAALLIAAAHWLLLCLMMLCKEPENTTKSSVYRHFLVYMAPFSLGVGACASLD